jgi:hypothetical protein
MEARTSIYEEWDDAHAAARQHVERELGQMGASPDTLAYVSGLRLYYRVMFLLSVWADTRQLRNQLTVSLATHVVSMKLLDDMIDADTELDRADLGIGCLRLLLDATSQLAAFGQVDAILTTLSRNFQHICKGQLACKRTPADTLDAWLAYADEYGARFLSTYGRIAGLACGLESRSRIPEQFASAFGMVITIADDLTDYHRKGERVGNLGHLIIGRRVDPDDVVKVLEQQRTTALTSARERPTAYDLCPIVDEYANDVVARILPGLLADRPTGT